MTVSQASRMTLALASPARTVRVSFLLIEAMSGRDDANVLTWWNREAPAYYKFIYGRTRRIRARNRSRFFGWCDVDWNGSNSNTRRLERDDAAALERVNERRKVRQNRGGQRFRHARCHSRRVLPLGPTTSALHAAPRSRFLQRASHFHRGGNFFNEGARVKARASSFRKT